MAKIFLPSHIWLDEKNPPGSDLRSVPRVFLSDRRSVKKSLWAPIGDRCPAFFYRPMNGSVKKSLRGPRSPIGPRVFLSTHEWVGKKIPPGAPIGDRAPAFFYPIKDR